MEQRRAQAEVADRISRAVAQRPGTAAVAAAAQISERDLAASMSGERDVSLAEILRLSSALSVPPGSFLEGVQA